MTQIFSLGDLAEKGIEISSLKDVASSKHRVYGIYFEIEDALRKAEKAVNLESYLLQEYHFNQRTVRDLADDFAVSYSSLKRLMKMLNIPIRSARETANLPELRERFSRAKRGNKNPLYGVRGKNHPGYGNKWSAERRKENSLNQLPEETIFPEKEELYDSRINQRMSLQAMGEKYGVGSRVISTWLDIYGVRLARSLLNQVYKKKIPKEELKRLVKTMTVEQIAKKFGTSLTTIYRRLHEYRIEPMAAAESRRRTQELNAQRQAQMISDYIAQANPGYKKQTLREC